MTDVRRPLPPQPRQTQSPPGHTALMDPAPDHGEKSYTGNGRLKGKVALITGADSGIGRAVAIAFAREGADIVISYLNEHEDAKETARWVTDAGRRAKLAAGDITNEQYCNRLVGETVEAFGRIDVLVNNAAFQRTYAAITDIPAEEWDTTFRTNIYAPFYLSKGGHPAHEGRQLHHQHNIDPVATALRASAGLCVHQGSRVQLHGWSCGNGCRTGHPRQCSGTGSDLDTAHPSTMPVEKTQSFGKQTLIGRAGQPAELAGAYVLLASDLGSYMTGAVVPVTGGEIMI